MTGERFYVDLNCTMSPCQLCIICDAPSPLSVILSGEIKPLAAVAWPLKREFRFQNSLIFPFPDDPRREKRKKKKRKTTHDILLLIKLMQ